jgi:hypothetical protein
LAFLKQLSHWIRLETVTCFALVHCMKTILHFFSKFCF